MKSVFIYGPPGVGKLTVAKELTRLTGYKLWDNHKSIDAVRPVFDFDDPPFWPLVSQIRRSVFQEAAKHGINLVFTFVYGGIDDLSEVERRVGSVTGQGGEVCFVQLTCSMEANEIRVVNASRINKLNTLAGLRSSYSKYDLLTPIEGFTSLQIDNTTLTPVQVARQIIEHYGLTTS